MGLETGTYINSLNANNPVNATDVVGQGDDHLRLIKSTILNTFPNIAGAMTLTHTQLNDAALKSSANVFLAQQSIESTVPILRMKDTDASLNEKVSRIAGSNDLWRLQFLTDDELTARNVIQVARSGADPGTMSIYNGTGVRLSIDSSGQVALRSVGNTDTEERRLMFEHQDGAVRAFVGHLSSGNFEVYNQVHGSAIVLTAEDAGGVARTLLNGDPDGALTGYYAGNDVIQTHANGLNISGSSANDPFIGWYTSDFATRQGYMQFSDTAGLTIRNEVHGTILQIQGEDAAGVNRNLITGNPDGSVTLYEDATLRFATIAQGARLYSEGNTDTEDRRIQFTHQNATVRANVGFIGNDVFTIRNQIHGGNLTLEAEDSGGVVRTLFTADPDSATTVRGDTQTIIQVAAGAIDACTFTSDGGIVTPNSEADEAGFKGAPVNVQNGNYTLALTDCGKTVRKESGGAGETYTVPATGTWPIGTIIVIHNDGGGDLSINGSGAATLEEWNGSTGNKTLPDNNKAILEYVGGNAWKYSATG